MLKLLKNNTSRQRRVIAAVVLAGCVVGAGGLAQAYIQQEPSSSDPIEHALGIDDAQTRTAILTAQARRQDRYEATLRSCLGASGFVVPPAAPSNAAPATSEDEFRARYGYGIAQSPTVGTPDPVHVYAATLDPERQRQFVAVLGDDDHGCIGQARATGASVRPASDALDSVVTSMYEELARDKRVKRATEAWVHCMGDPSDFNSPAGITEFLASRRASISSEDTNALTQLAAEERQLAAQDKRCQEEVVDPVYKPLLREWQQRLVDEHPEVFAAWRSAMLAG